MAALRFIVYSKELVGIKEIVTGTFIFTQKGLMVIRPINVMSI